MSTVAVGMSVGSFVWVMTTVVAYFRKIPQGEVTVDISGLVFKLLIGIGLAGGAIVWSVQTGSIHAVAIAPAVFATMLATMLLYLLTQRKTPVGDLKVKVGDRLLAFEATTSEGNRFHTDELAGKRMLLKFFRGGW